MKQRFISAQMVNDKKYCFLYEIDKMRMLDTENCQAEVNLEKMKTVLNQGHEKDKDSMMERPMKNLYCL